MALPAPDARLLAPRPPARHRRTRPLAPPQPRAHRHIRRTRLVVFGALAIIVAAMLLVAIGSALVVSQQVRLDAAEQSLAAASTRNTNLQVQRAELASPTKVLAVAQTKLGMVTPRTVFYLVPVKIGPTVGSTKHSTHK